MPKSIWWGFKVSGWAFKRAISALHRSSQRTVRSQERLEYSWVDGFSTHSSKAIAMVEPRWDWICIDFSGLMKIFRPSMWEAKVTPSSWILRREAREKTWNPPESVRMGLSHPINLCSPPSR